MTNPVSHIKDSWNVVQHSWNQTGIYANESGQQICMLDLERWDVNEDNQYDLEEIQLQNARLIAASPDLLKVMQAIQEGVTNGTIQMNNALQEMVDKVINKATIDPIE